MRKIIPLVQKNLLEENGVPFYAHFYRNDELIVVFPDRVFYLKPDRSAWTPAVTYGKNLGIPEERLNFKPAKFEDETY